MDGKKLGWTEKGIAGAIFAPLGLVFVTVGGLVIRYVDLSPDDRLAFLIGFVGLGAAFLLAGGLLLAKDLLRRRRQRIAYEGGRCVTGKLAGLRTIGRVNLNGSHPVVAEVHYTDPDTGVVHVYFSRYLTIHVEDLLTSDEVPVYLDRGDDRVGFVDIDAVLPAIVVHR